MLSFWFTNIYYIKVEKSSEPLKHSVWDRRKKTNSFTNVAVANSVKSLGRNSTK